MSAGDINVGAGLHRWGASRSGGPFAEPIESGTHPHESVYRCRLSTSNCPAIGTPTTELRPNATKSKAAYSNRSEMMFFWISEVPS